VETARRRAAELVAESNRIRKELADKKRDLMAGNAELTKKLAEIDQKIVAIQEQKTAMRREISRGSEEIRTQLSALQTEQTQVRKEIETKRQATLKENPELVAKVAEIDRQIQELTQRKDSVVRDASPDLQKSQERLDAILKQQRDLYDRIVEEQRKTADKVRAQQDAMRGLDEQVRALAKDKDAAVEAASPEIKAMTARLNEIGEEQNRLRAVLSPMRTPGPRAVPPPAPEKTAEPQRPAAAGETR